MIVNPSPGTLYAYPGDPNPAGAPASSLYLFQGDALDQPVESLLTAPGLVLPSRSDQLLNESFRLRILHFNDLHGHVVRFSSGKEESVISHHAWQIKNERLKIAEDPNQAVLVLGSGDDCGGSIFDEMLAGNMLDHPINPSYQLFSKIGVDAACVGNHDLDRGLHLLTRTISQQARFPVLATNLKVCQELQGVCQPAAILVIKGIRIGMIGLVTRAESHLDPAICQLIDPRIAAQNILPVLRPYCDAVIILSHLGFSLSNMSVPMADAGDVELARSLPEKSADLIIGGHSHDALNMTGLEEQNIINTIPIVQAGASGHFLGQVKMVIDLDGASIEDARLLTINNTPVDHDFEDQELKPLSNWANELLNRELGRIEDDIALSDESVLKGFSTCEVALANYVTDALVKRLAALDRAVDLALIDSSTLQGGLALADVLTFGECFQLMPYSDLIRIYQLTGGQLRELIQDNALRIILPDQLPEERGFLQFSKGLRYQIVFDPTSKTKTAEEITFNNKPLESYHDKIFRVAATSFTRESAFPWEWDWQEKSGEKLTRLSDFPFRDTDLILRDEIIRFVQSVGGITHQSGAVKDGRLLVVPARKEG